VKYGTATEWNKNFISRVGTGRQGVAGLKTAASIIPQ
jgi:hypothetical protein